MLCFFSEESKLVPPNPALQGREARPYEVDARPYFVRRGIILLYIYLYLQLFFMGQKVNPISLRLQKTNRHFDSSWYNEYNYTSLFLQDLQINNYLNSILKQIQYSQGRIIVLNLPKKIYINFFYFNPKKIRTQNNQAFQIVRKNKKKSSYFTSFFRPEGKIEKPFLSASDYKSSKNYKPISNSLVQRNSKNHFLPIKDLASSYYFSQDRKNKKLDYTSFPCFAPGRDVKKEKKNLIKFLLTSLNTNKSKENPVSLHKKQNEIPLLAYPNPALQGREEERHAYKNIENPLKILQSSALLPYPAEQGWDEQSYKNYSVLPKERKGDYMNMLQEREVRSNFEVDVSNLKQKEVLVSGLSTLYQSWIGKKDLSLFTSFFYFYLRSTYKNKSPSEKRSFKENFFPYSLQSKGNRGKDMLRKSKINISSVFSKEENLLLRTEKLNGRQISSSKISKKSKKLLNRYLLFLFYKQFLNNKNIKNFFSCKKRLGFEFLNGSSLPIPLKISDLLLFSDHDVSFSFPSSTILVKDTFHGKHIKPYKEASHVTKVKNINHKNSPSKGVPSFSREEGWRYKSHIEFTFLKNLKSSTNLRFFRSFTEKQSALFLAQEIIYYLQLRIPFRRIKNQILRSIGKTKIIKGIRITCSGRVGGKSKKAQRAKVETLKLGQTSLHVFSSKIDFACKSALTNFGLVGVKVWICYF